jgi:hypothetical protein
MPEAFRVSPATRYYMKSVKQVVALSDRVLTLKNSVLVSTAAPTSGALMPLYIPRKPSCCSDFLKQSNGPLYLNGTVSGCDWRRTLTVSKGYSMYFPTIPASDPHTTSFRASSPCPAAAVTALGRPSSIMTGLLDPPLAPTTDTGPSCSSIYVLGLSICMYVRVQSVTVKAVSRSWEHGTVRSSDRRR